MTWVSNPDSILGSGWLTSQYTGMGVSGSAISASGLNGPSPVYNDSPNPAKEYFWKITSRPLNGSFTAFEDLTCEHISTIDGLDSFTYELFENVISVGSATVTFIVGGPVVTINAIAGNMVGNFALSNQGSTYIYPENITSLSSIDNISLSTGDVLTIFDISNNQNIDNISLSYDLDISIDGIDQANFIDNLDASKQENLQISSIFQTTNIDIIQLIQSQSNSYPTPEEIAAALLISLNSTTIPVDVKKMNGANVLGNGTTQDKWRGV